MPVNLDDYSMSVSVNPVDGKPMTNVNAQLSGSITTNPTAVPVGAASVQVLAANPNRKYASFQNDSDTVIYILSGTGPAALNQGIRLNPNGGVYEMSSAMGNLDLRAVYAISSSASKNLLVREGI